MQIVGWVKWCRFPLKNSNLHPQLAELIMVIDSFPNSMGFQRSLFVEHDAVEWWPDKNQSSGCDGWSGICCTLAFTIYNIYFIFSEKKHWFHGHRRSLFPSPTSCVNRLPFFFAKACEDLTWFDIRHLMLTTNQIFNAFFPLDMSFVQTKNHTFSTPQPRTNDKNKELESCPPFSYSLGQTTQMTTRWFWRWFAFGDSSLWFHDLGFLERNEVSCFFFADKNEINTSDGNKFG